MEKYTYQDWIEGKVQANNLSDLVASNIISVDVYNKIKFDQELAYIIYIFLKLQTKKISFYKRYDRSLVKNDLLNLQIEIAAKDLENFKTQYPDIYIGALNGLDYRFNLTPKFIYIMIFCPQTIDEFEKIIPTHLTFYIKSIFFKWLKWLKSEANKDSEPFIDINHKKIKDFFKFNEHDLEVGGQQVSIDFLLIEMQQQEMVIFETKEQILENYKYVDNFSTTTLSISKTGNTLSYKWQCNPEKELPELYQLVKGKFISESTTLEQFTAVFTGQPLEQINPIKWHEDNASELLYFIMHLEETESIEKDSNRADFKKLAACFVKPDGSLFTARFKALKQNINKDLASDKQKAIQELIKAFQ